MSRTAVPLRAVAAAALGLVLLVVGAGAASAAPSSQDTTWMVAAHQSNLTEIAAGQAAQQKATSQQVKDLGAMFIQMHTALDADLTAAAKTLGVSLPGAPSPAQQATLASVSAKSGAAFDSAWVTSQIAGHRATLAATQKEVSSGSDPTVIKLATAATPVVQQHLNALLALPQAAPSSVQAGTGGQAASDRAPWLLALAAAGFALLAGAGVTAVRRRQHA
jgi:putative membrane protein